MLYSRSYESPIGRLTLTSDGTFLTSLCLGGPKRPETACAVLDLTTKWLDEYFSGNIPDFVPPLLAHGSPFQKRVWALLLTIPYGETVTYGQLAAAISPTMSAQAIGGAVGRNPIAILIPCHRVLAAGGKIGGYAYGTAIKQKLLQIEKRQD